MILRFMGDLPEPKLPEVPDQKVKSLGKRLRESIGKKSESQVAAVCTGSANFFSSDDHDIFPFSIKGNGSSE